MDLALLDTDLLSELLKQKDPQVVLHAAAYLKQHGQFAFSAFTSIRGHSRFESQERDDAAREVRDLLPALADLPGDGCHF